MKTPACTTCTLLSRMPRHNGRFTFVCRHSGVIAHAERANPNGCGPIGAHWTNKPVSVSPAVKAAEAAMAAAQAALAAAVAEQSPAAPGISPTTSHIPAGPAQTGPLAR